MAGLPRHMLTPWQRRSIVDVSRVCWSAVRLWLDRRIMFPRPSNACSNFDEGVGWTFFDLTTLHDEFRDEPGSVVEADFYHAATLLPMSDEEIVQKVNRPPIYLKVHKLAQWNKVSSCAGSCCTRWEWSPGIKTFDSLKTAKQKGFA